MITNAPPGRSPAFRLVSRPGSQSRPPRAVDALPPFAYSSSGRTADSIAGTSVRSQVNKYFWAKVMKRETRYIIAAICVSIGVLLWFTGKPLLFPFGTILICAQSLPLLSRGELTKPVRFKKPEWKPRDFFGGICIVLFLALFLVLFFQLPEDQARKLFTKWYFSGTFWLLCMSGLIKSYIEKKANAQQAGPDATRCRTP